MKKFVLLFAFLLISSFTYAANGDDNKKSDDTIVTKKSDGITVSIISVKEINDSDALYCSINCGDGREYSCWLCSCESLPDCSGSAPSQQ